MSLISFNKNISFIKKNESFPVLITFQGFSSSLLPKTKSLLPFFMLNSLTDAQLDINIIFVKDVEQCWYLTGYNGKSSHNDFYTDIKKIINDNFKKSKIITIGQSSGGFGALLFGNLLNADKIITFVPQTSCYKGLNIECPYSEKKYNKISRIYRRNQLDNLNDKSFYNLKNHLSKNIPIDYYIGTNNYDNIMLNNLLTNNYNNINVIKVISNKDDTHLLNLKKNDYLNIIKKNLMIYI
jgi:hypothetical protein